jgi:ABC-type glycerol-3-phosphate transport system substrate-binding protein
MVCCVGILAVIFLSGCRSWKSVSGKSAGSNPSAEVSLTMMAMVDGSNAAFENEALRKFAGEKGYQIRYFPYLESTHECLDVYRQLFQDRSTQPDICEIDVIWPAILANDLVDLTPYLGDDIKAFPPELIQSFTIGGRLVAIPIYLDVGRIGEDGQGNPGRRKALWQAGFLGLCMARRGRRGADLRRPGMAKFRGWRAHHRTRWNDPRL